MKIFAKAATAMVVSAACLQAPITFADSASSYDDGRGWYVGGELSYVDGEAEIGNLYKLGEEGIGFGAYGGYNFTNWFALEGAIFQSTDMADERQNLYSADFSSLSVMPKFTINMGSVFALYAKAGPTFVLYTEEYDDYYGYWRYRDDEADWSEILLGAGVGAQFKLPNNIHLRLGYDYVSGKLDETWDTRDSVSRRVDVTLRRVSFGMHYQF